MRQLKTIHPADKFEAKTGLKEGAHVRYIGINDFQRQFLSNDYSDPDGILDLETIYEIEYIEIGRSFSVVKLVGFKDKEFLGGIFEAVNKAEPKKCLKAGDKARYVGTSEESLRWNGIYFDDPRGILNIGTVYEVEHMERCSDFEGYTGVKLIGFKEMFNRILFEKNIN